MIKSEKSTSGFLQPPFLLLFDPLYCGNLSSAATVLKEEVKEEEEEEEEEEGLLLLLTTLAAPRL